MMSQPLISIIVPVYNAGEYLNQCIKSLIRQTYANLEIILVDDGSTDGSAKICDCFSETDARIKVIHKHNGGASSARNVGLDESKGDYIAFVDADDYLDSDMYEIMLQEILEHNADAARCGIVRESPNGYKEEWGDDNADVEVIENYRLLCDIGEANGILPVSPCNKLFSKKCIGNTRFDERFKYAEDTLFNFEVAKSINAMIYHDVCRYHYVLNIDSASHRIFDEQRLDEHRVMDVIINESPSDVLPYCVKGDVMKSFRTLKEMLRDDECLDQYDMIRSRIIMHTEEILKSNLFSKAAKIKTVLLRYFPSLYKKLLKKHAVKSEKKYWNLAG